MCPYNQTDTRVHGFIGTHQPAVWMGESGPAQLSAGLGRVVTEFHARGLSFRREDEYASGNYYVNTLRAEEGTIRAELTASECGLYTIRAAPLCYVGVGLGGCH